MSINTQKPFAEHRHLNSKGIDEIVKSIILKFIYFVTYLINILYKWHINFDTYVHPNIKLIFFKLFTQVSAMNVSNRIHFFSEYIFIHSIQVV